MEKKIKLGIIGIGNMGTSHTKKINAGMCPEIELVAVSDTNAERVAWFKENIKSDVTFFDDAIAMLDSGLIDSCLVAVPHYDHAKYAIECMKRGIHVMVEKPAGVYTKQAREMNEEAEKHPEVVFGMMFNQRTNHVYRKLRDLVQSGEYGEIRRILFIVTDWYRPQCYYDSGDWRATWSGEGGGVLINQCPHQLDLWQWICGMPVRLQSYMHFGKWHNIEVEDDVTTYFEYENGATGVFVASTGDAHGTERLEIQLDKAKLVVEDDKLTVLEYCMTEQEYSRTHVGKPVNMAAEEVIPETDGKNEQHVGVLNAWAGAILRGETMVAHGSEGINGLMLSNAMHLSAFLGKMVELPIDEDLYYEELSKRIATSRRKENVRTTYVDIEGTFAGNK